MTSKIPTVSYFCCCIDLRTGGLIVGWIGVVSSILYILESLRTGNTLGHSIAIQLVLSACWLYGVKENRPSFMLFTVILDGIVLICLYICVFVLAVVLLIASPSSDDDDRITFGFLLLVTFVSVTLTYFWIMMYSVYKHIKENTSGLAM
ncbi:uncharacterized protein LOC116348823 [Contarinia nasturtii]|uniref:uncharacterized protein LOC116348823 n=1 Tax=Contarinia nasturtii TaxID=265458 RepID=UPI0012D43BA4|nr:uncharacterized protein LOC116348823 [Contarinia nasturtii]